MSQLLKTYKAPSLELVCKVIEAGVIPQQMFGLKDTVKTWFKNMLNDGYLVTFERGNVPTEWYKDENDNDQYRLFTGHLVKEFDGKKAYYWAREKHEHDYIHNNMIKVVKAWEEIEQQAKLFLKHNKCIVISAFDAEDMYNQEYNKIFDHFTFECVSASVYIDYLESRDKYYKIKDIESHLVFDEALICRNWDYYRNLKLFSYFKPQSVQFSTFINGKNVKEKVNVGDFWVDYATDTVFQESEDFLGNKILKFAEHPHISGGRVCAGGWSQSWNECRNLGRIFGWHSGFALFLRRYNSRSPYNQPLLFKTDFKLKVEDETFEYKFESPAEAIKVMNLRSRVTGSRNIENLIPHLKRCKHNNISATRYFESLNLLNRLSNVCNRELRHANSSKKTHVKEIYHETMIFLKNNYDVRDYEMWEMKLADKDYFGKAIHNLWKDCNRFRDLNNNDNSSANRKPTLKQILLAARGHYSRDENLARTLLNNQQVYVNGFYSRIVNRYKNYENKMFIYAKRRALKAAKASISETRDFVKTLNSLDKDLNFRVIGKLYKEFETKLDMRGQQI